MGRRGPCESMNCVDWLCVFFFQAEDGIRDDLVTGVQTCALPIFLRGARKREVALHVPRARVRVIGRAPEVLCIFADSASPYLFELLEPREFLTGNARGVMQKATGIGCSYDLGTQLGQLSHREQSHVTRAGNDRR